MTLSKHTLKNRHGLQLVIQVDASGSAEDLVFIAHGQGGFKEQEHIQAFANAFLRNNYRVVRFDATYALGESDGDMTDVTYDTYVSDLEDVIQWASEQEWFMKPFVLCGHSMGAQSTAWYAEQHPENVALLAPMAPTINYDLYTATMSKDAIMQWKTDGYKSSESRSKPGVVKKIGWQVVESLKKFDILANAGALTMPILNIVGEFDEPCPVDHQRILFERIGIKDKKLVVIKDVEHSYRNNETGQYDEHLATVENTMAAWINAHKA